MWCTEERQGNFSFRVPSKQTVKKQASAHGANTFLEGTTRHQLPESLYTVFLGLVVGNLWPTGMNVFCYTFVGALPLELVFDTMADSIGRKADTF